MTENQKLKEENERLRKALREYVEQGGEVERLTRTVETLRKQKARMRNAFNCREWRDNKCLKCSGACEKWKLG